MKLIIAGLVALSLMGICQAESGDLTIKGTPAKESALSIYSSVAFHSPEIFRIEDSGDIYWRGRKIDTDRELGKAFLDVIRNNVCPKCKERR